MSRPAKPKPNGDPPDHRIQVGLPDAEWRKATKAAKANGLPAVASLCRMLLQREYERLGITDETVAESPKRSRKRKA